MPNVSRTGSQWQRHALGCPGHAVAVRDATCYVFIPIVVRLYLHMVLFALAQLQTQLLGCLLLLIQEEHMEEQKMKLELEEHLKVNG